MAINKKFIHAKTLAEFQKELSAGHILDESIVFIKDAQKIWTHGQYYSITDAPADGNSYVRKNNGWVISPPSGIEVYIGKDKPSDEYKVWFNTKDGSLYYYNEGWVDLYIGEPRNLSMRDIHGNIRSTATTANCYVIKERAIYRIPLVYGNAIVNGSTNSASYTKVGNVYTLDFVNGAGTVINTPFIEKQTTISSAELSIADTDSIFTDISVKSNPNVTDISNCGYIQFKVASIPSTGANGVISVKDSSGTIIWNWHIWVWTDNLSTVGIANGYNILPYNLASKWDSSDKTHIKNWYYQWGRSVPMLCSSAYNSTTDSNSYGTLSFNSESQARSYSKGIANPTTFYEYRSSSYNWFDSGYYNSLCYNLWDANCTSQGVSDNVTVKTVYDPCPPGFKIPNGNTFTGLQLIDGGSWNSGYTWNGSFFPASGERNASGGYLYNVGSTGYAWTSASDSSGNAYHMMLRDGAVYQSTYSYRAYGYSVRPVAEQ